METKTLFLYLIIAIALTALIIAIIAVVQSNNNNDSIKNLQNQTVNFTILKDGNTTLVGDNLVASVPTKAIVIKLPTDNWDYSSYILGMIGNIYITTSVTTTITWNAKYTINGGDEKDLIGAIDYTTTGEFLVNLNGVTEDIIAKNDVIVINLYANSLVNTTINNDPQTLNASVTYGPVKISS